MVKENEIHPTAIIGQGVVMGTGNYIGPYVVLGENVILGNDNYIGPHCIIGDVGESVNFFDKHRLGVIIGNNNRFTKQVTIDGGTENPTRIFDNTIWLKNAHAGHDCIIHNGVQVRCNAIIGGHVEIFENVKIYLGVIIHQRMTIPANCIFGMGAVLLKKVEVEANGVYVGNPARLIRINQQ